MSKAIVEITIRKDNDANYARRELITVDYDVYRIIHDCAETCTIDEYDAAWTQFIDEIHNQVSNLPNDWYMCRSERKLIECY